MRAARHHRRGAMYIAVLMTATMVAVLGVSGLFVARVHLRSVQGSTDAISADIGAQSAIELALAAIDADSAWRTTYTHNVWVPGVARGVSYQWKLFDEINADLNADPTATLRLFGQASAGDAVRTYSLLIQPRDLTPNLLGNPGMETGTAEWYGYSCGIKGDKTQAHGGRRSIKTKNRTDFYSGPAQDLTRTVQNGQTYDMDVWVRAKSGTISIRFVMYIRSRQFFPWVDWLVSNSVTVGSGGWTRVAASMTPSWSGTLEEVFIKISTPSGTGDYYIDDASFRVPQSGPAVVPVPGSWRREVTP